MEVDGRGKAIETVTFYPKDFFNKTKNEPFIQMLMQFVFPETLWRRGNPLKCEPDYFCDELPFEFTIASNRKDSQTLVTHLIRGQYHSENIEEEVFSHIRESIEAKAQKNYSVSGIHLCVLCLLDMFCWVSDEFGSTTHFIFDNPREQFFNEIRINYISTKMFRNIFIIFPDLTAKWWVWNVLSNEKTSFQLRVDMIRSSEYPYTLTKNQFDTILGGDTSVCDQKQN